MADQREREVQGEGDLSPEDYERWKTDGSEAARAKVEPLVDIDHEGGKWDINVSIGDLSFRKLIVILAISLVILAILLTALLI